MRWLLLTVILVVGLFALGWLYVEYDNDRTELILDHKRVQQDASTAVTTGQDALENVGDSLESAGDEVERATDSLETATDETPDQISDDSF